MTKINPQTLTVGSFRGLWSASFSASKERCLHLYKAMRVSIDHKKEIEAGMAADDPFTFVWVGGCWENVIIPVYILNGEKLEGNFKVLSNAKKKYHFVIFDVATNVIYDPTYEKHPSWQLLAPKNLCQGTGCTTYMLGKRLRYFDLGYYLRDYEHPGDLSITSEIRDYGGRFLGAVAASQ